jgi:hypothetical protein
MKDGICRVVLWIKLADIAIEIRSERARYKRISMAYEDFNLTRNWLGR